MLDEFGHFIAGHHLGFAAPLFISSRYSGSENISLKPLFQIEKDFRRPTVSN